jgi:ribosomal protein S12 methylthiotransferase
LPQKYEKETFEGLTEADVLLGIHDYESFFDALEKSYTGERVDFVGQGKDREEVNRLVTTPSHYAYLKISDGCNNHCTYCLIPKIRGAYQSYPMETLVQEVESLGEVTELILVAQDVTRYGQDLYGEIKLVELLQRLTALENIGAVRLLYCYPDQITDELIAELRDNPKLIKYLDIPLQHSEDRVLKLMNRTGTRAEYLALLAKLRKEIPAIAIRSTFISGFPTETDAECEAMCNFLQEAKLTNCGFFAYSREPETPAYKLKGQVPYAVKKRRVKKLYEVQKGISKNFLKQFEGQTLAVVCDGIDYDKNCFVGRTYFQAPDIDGKVYFNANEAMQGKTYKVKITYTDCYDLYGQTEDYEI